MRLILSILAGLVVLIGTVQGMRIPFRQGYFHNIDDTLEAAAFDDDFLQYLLQQESETEADNGCSFTTQGYGGGGGNPFDELPANCTAIVKKILIRAALYVDAIQITYQLPNGKEQVGDYHGGQGGKQYVIDIDVKSGERIIGIFGRSLNYLDQLGFATNKGRIFGPYGGCGGNPFTVNSCNIGGIFGRSFDWMDSIGFYCNAP